MKRDPDTISFGQILEDLAQFPETKKYWVGFSGGADSTALLQVLHELDSQIQAQIHAIHFDHQLQAQSTQWRTHCQEFCAQRNIPLEVISLDLNKNNSMSQEERARVHRYSEVEKLLDYNELYLTAHHADDNAETLFINLMRGSGMDGLAGVPYSRKIGKGRIIRPLLNYQRVDLQSFLRKRHIDWIEDPSNSDTNFDRNYIRNKVFPDLEQQWPGLIQRLNQTANHARASAEMMSTLIMEQYRDLVGDAYTLYLEPLLAMQAESQAIVLRQWLKNRGAVGPPRARLGEFLTQINNDSNFGSEAELRWLDWQVKKHDEFLWLEELPSPAECPDLVWFNTNELNIGHEFGKIVLQGKNPLPPGHWVIGPRRAGAKMTLKTGEPRRKLKDLMRLSGIPTWLRPSIPILYWNNKLAAVGDWILSTELKHFLSANSITYKWLPSNPLLSKLQSVSVQRLGSTES